MDASSKACKSKCDRTHYYSLGSVTMGVFWSQIEEMRRDVLWVGGLIVRETTKRTEEAGQRFKSENLAWLECMIKWVCMLAC